MAGNEAKQEWRMHVPPAYRAPDPQAIVRQWPFAMLVTSDSAGRPFVTQTPIHFETDAPGEDRLIGHFAKANPHSRQLADGAPVLAVFPGPHTYISPAWYHERPTVPTWNYITAQLRGTIKIFDSDDERRMVLERTVALAEEDSNTGWQLADAPEGKVDALLPHIVAFRIQVESIEGSTKLSQTHPESDRRSVIEGLEQRAGEGDLAIAALMAEAKSAIE